MFFTLEMVIEESSVGVKKYQVKNLAMSAAVVILRYCNIAILRQQQLKILNKSYIHTPFCPIFARSSNVAFKQSI